MTIPLSSGGGPASLGVSIAALTPSIRLAALLPTRAWAIRLH